MVSAQEQIIEPIIVETFTVTTYLNGGIGKRASRG